MSDPLSADPFRIPATQLGAARETRFGTGSDFVAESVRIANRESDTYGPRGVRQRIRAQRFDGTPWIRDLNGGIAVSRAADDGLARIDVELERLQRLSESARDAAADNATNPGGTNGVLRDSQRSIYQRQFDEIVDRIRDIADETEFRGLSLLRKTDPDAKGFEFSGRDRQSFEVPIQDFSVKSLGLQGFDVAGQSTQKALSGARDRVQDARSSLDELNREVVRSIHTELRRVPASRRLENPAEALALVDETKQSLLRPGGFGARAHAPRFDAAATVLA